jgi:hypothetical protein
VAARTVWHPAFAALIRERCPSDLDVDVEIALSLEPQRADLVVVRRRRSRRDDGRVLRRLWPMLSNHAIIEYKSVSRPPRAGDAARLLGYGAQYHAGRTDAIGRAPNLSLVLITAAMTPALERDLDRMGWRADDLGDGYLRVRGTCYPAFIVLLDDAAEAERDPLLGAFGHRTLGATDREAALWFLAHVAGVREVDMSQHEGYDDYIEKLRRVISPEVLARVFRPEDRVAGLKPEERVAGLKPEDRVAGLKPEERVAGLKPEERSSGLRPDETVLLLADEILRALPDDLLDRLEPGVRAEVRRRIGR